MERSGIGPRTSCFQQGPEVEPFADLESRLDLQSHKLGAPPGVLKLFGYLSAIRNKSPRWSFT